MSSRIPYFCQSLSSLSCHLGCIVLEQRTLCFDPFATMPINSVYEGQVYSTIPSNKSSHQPSMVALTHGGIHEPLIPSRSPPGSLCVSRPRRQPMTPGKICPRMARLLDMLTRFQSWKQCPHLSLSLFLSRIHPRSGNYEAHCVCICSICCAVTMRM